MGMGEKMVTEKEILESEDFWLQVHNTPYAVTCDKCNKETKVYTQNNWEYSEYQTTVFAPCRYCGEYLKFVLPVN
jgi:DNA-directed RNA polymerase subunit M/transcription elongation factor TFIIS